MRVKVNVAPGLDSHTFGRAEIHLGYGLIASMSVARDSSALPGLLWTQSLGSSHGMLLGLGRGFGGNVDIDFGSVVAYAVREPAPFVREAVVGFTYATKPKTAFPFASVTGGWSVLSVTAQRVVEEWNGFIGWRMTDTYEMNIGLNHIGRSQGNDLSISWEYRW